MKTNIQCKILGLALAGFMLVGSQVANAEVTGAASEGYGLKVDVDVLGADVLEVGPLGFASGAVPNPDADGYNRTGTSIKLDASADTSAELTSGSLLDTTVTSSISANANIFNGSAMSDVDGSAGSKVTNATGSVADFNMALSLGQDLDLVKNTLDTVATELDNTTGITLLSPLTNILNNLINTITGTVSVSDPITLSSSAAGQAFDQTLWSKAEVQGSGPGNLAASGESFITDLDLNVLGLFDLDVAELAKANVDAKVDADGKIWANANTYIANDVLSLLGISLILNEQVTDCDQPGFCSMMVNAFHLNVNIGTLLGLNLGELVEVDVVLGHSYAEMSAVPVPAAVWLFGSGLMGLVGLSRRRQSQLSA